MGFDLACRLALHLSGRVGPVLYARLSRRFPDSDALRRAGVQELIQVDGIGPDTARAIRMMLDTGAAAREIERCRREGIRLLEVGEEGYPAWLARTIDAPRFLYVAGRLEPADQLAVAVVGTRRPSRYGRRVSRGLARGLARAGVTVVSGLARGIDAEAHLGSLDAGGRTIAVLGCGLGRVYPPEHRGLAERIRRSGAVIAEFPWDEPPRPANFPRRNRIISGLSWMTVCVEGSLTSGALSTCDWALEQGRSVGAVPGPVQAPLSRGPHHLLRQGARVVEDVADVLEELPGWVSLAEGDPVERLVRWAVERGARGVREVCRLTGLRSRVVARVLQGRPGN